MNPFFIVLVLISAVALWLALRWIFNPAGRWIQSIFQDTKEIMNESEEKNHDEQR